jgi:hypothetical protein
MTPSAPSGFAVAFEVDETLVIPRLPFLGVHIAAIRGMAIAPDLEGLAGFAIGAAV